MTLRNLPTIPLTPAPLARIVACLALTIACWAGILLPSPTAAAATRVTWGAYAGPALVGVAGVQDLVTRGVRVGLVLDFLPPDTWAHLKTSQWVFDAHKNSPYPLELSLPMLPRASEGSLTECARGGYDDVWARLAGFAEARGMSATTTIRPGWEMNGNWFRWSAIKDPDAYVRCFRSLVHAMREVAPALKFNWSVGAGVTSMDARLAYPGDDVVDVISADIYDQSWVYYPTPPGMTTANARKYAVKAAITGAQGLQYWASFAGDHGKPFAISEWGLTWRSDGHGGGDNTTFAKAIMKFVTKKSNRVAYATYFNNADTDFLKHNITNSTTAFPKSGALVLKRMQK